MQKLTNEQYKILKNYEVQLEQATHNYTSHITKKDIEILKPIYESFGYKLVAAACGSCILSMLKKLNQYYIEYDKSKSKK